jgi:hypothetical protein
MTEPLDSGGESRRENADTTRMMREGQAYDLPDDRFDMLMPNEPLAPEPQNPPKLEPLFNKKVMVVWAVAAFTLWFAVTQVIPVALRSAKTAIAEAVEEAGRPGANGQEKIIVLPNGKRIIIKTDPATHTMTVKTVERDVIIGPTQPAPAGTAAPAQPATPAAPPAPTATGGKRK